MLELTPREKYDAFRALYGNHDTQRADHVRFDKLIRILLGLPATDPVPYKVGDFVCMRSGAIVRVEEVTPNAYSDTDDVALKCRDAAGLTYSFIPGRSVQPVKHWNTPLEERPF